MPLSATGKHLAHRYRNNGNGVKMVSDVGRNQKCPTQEAADAHRPSLRSLASPAHAHDLDNASGALVRQLRGIAPFSIPGVARQELLDGMGGVVSSGHPNIHHGQNLGSMAATLCEPRPVAS